MGEYSAPIGEQDVNAWCELLGLVHDEAKDAGEDFLAYLAGVALTHAHSLRRTLHPFDEMDSPPPQDSLSTRSSR
jgi:hypothetical protein